MGIPVTARFRVTAELLHTLILVFGAMWAVFVVLFKLVFGSDRRHD